MNKKFLLPGLALFLLAPIVYGAYEYTWNVLPAEIDNRNNNIIFERDNETYLIHHKTGCGDLTDDNRLVFIIRGELDGNNDAMRKGNDRQCIVDRADIINGYVIVDDVTTSNTNIEVKDENGERFRIYYSEKCKAVKGFNKKKVYIYHNNGQSLNEGDTMFLPGGGESCTITNVQSREPVQQKAKAQSPFDIKRPTTPTRFRAIPTTKAVYLYWTAAQDDSGIDHYEINASLYHYSDEIVRDPVNQPMDLPDIIKTETDKTSLRIDYLESDELYFFRIIAVDKAGNKSPYWSQEATARTRSSIAERTLEIDGGLTNIKLIQETNRSFYFVWNEAAGVRRRTVILEADGKRIYTNNSWPYDKIRILKKTERKGKPLRLTIRTYDFRGVTQEDQIEFSF